MHPLDRGIKLESRAEGSTSLQDSSGLLWQGEIEVGTPPVTYTGKFKDLLQLAVSILIFIISGF